MMLLEKHTLHPGGRPKCPLFVFNADKSFYKRYDSTEIAATDLKLKYFNIDDAMRKKKLHGGYYFSRSEVLTLRLETF